MNMLYTTDKDNNLFILDMERIWEYKDLDTQSIIEYDYNFLEKNGLKDIYKVKCKLEELNIIQMDAINIVNFYPAEKIEQLINFRTIRMIGMNKLMIIAYGKEFEFI